MSSSLKLLTAIVAAFAIKGVVCAPAPDADDVSIPESTPFTPVASPTGFPASVSATMIPAEEINVPANTTEALETRDFQKRAVGGFAQSCQSWGGSYGNISGKGFAILQATCRTKSGSQKTTTLDLNKCMANYNGNIACATNGAFLQSCSVSNSLTTGNTILSLICGNGSGGYTRPGFDVNRCVGNLDGNLAC